MGTYRSISILISLKYVFSHSPLHSGNRVHDDNGIGDTLAELCYLFSVLVLSLSIA